MEERKKRKKTTFDAEDGRLSTRRYPRPGRWQKIRRKSERFEERCTNNPRIRAEGGIGRVSLISSRRSAVFLAIHNLFSRAYLRETRLWRLWGRELRTGRDRNWSIIVRRITREKSSANDAFDEAIAYDARKNENTITMLHEYFTWKLNRFETLRTNET